MKKKKNSAHARDTLSARGFSMILRYFFTSPTKQRFEMAKESGLGLAFRVRSSSGGGEHTTLKGYFFP